MLQRKQTLYLLVSFILTVILLFSNYLVVEPLSTIGIKSLDQMSAIEFSVMGNYMAGMKINNTVWLLVLTIVAALMSFVTIFLYRHRWLQVRLCLAAVALYVGLEMFLGYYVYTAISTVNEMGGAGAQYKVVLLFPIFSALASYLAYKGVAHDIALLRSADRIR